MQNRAFSGDDGISGHGIAVHLGTFDGVRGINGATWSGTLRGQSFSIPFGAWRTYSWDLRTQNLRTERPSATHRSVKSSGLDDFAYRVERSDDLNAWTNLGAPSGSPASSEMNERVPFGAAKRFCRVVTTASL